MSNGTSPSRGLCPAPFFASSSFPDEGGFVDGRLCQTITPTLKCCLPCPLTDWVYPDNFDMLANVANWACVVGTICCVFLLLSWAFLPVEKTHRHYLSICLTSAVVLMNMGFVIPLAAKPEECFNEITPHSMESSRVCAASGTFLLLGGWAGVMWVFLRALSLHLQICWQVVVGRSFMFFSQAAGWGVPILAVVLALVFSGVSFRFGATCHINHRNSLAGFWIPLLVFAGLTLIIQFATFGYCIKVYLASLADNSASTEGSSLPTYSNSIRTMTPRQAYRRVRRVIQLQWRGIAIVLVIIADVIFFSVIFVFQDTTVQAVHNDSSIASEWVFCLVGAGGDKNKCLDKARTLVLSQATIMAVLLLLSLNGVWLLFLLGRWSMVMGWVDLVKSATTARNKKEFVSVDARYDLKKDTRAYEMLSRDSSAAVTPITPVKSPEPFSGRHTPDYFGQTARYQAPTRSFSSPRPPQPQSPQSPQSPQQPTWDARRTYARPGATRDNLHPNTNHVNFSDQHLRGGAYAGHHSQMHSQNGSGRNDGGMDDMNPLGMNRI